jgi:hypothetical protein
MKLALEFLRRPSAVAAILLLALAWVRFVAPMNSNGRESR